MTSNVDPDYLTLNWKDPNKWHTYAMCRSSDPEIFYSTEQYHETTAVSICSRCPVKSQCRTWALEKDERFGTWGGLTESQRRRVGTRRTRSRCPGCKSYDIKELHGRHESCLSCGLTWPI